jgi:hypothetical protein
MGDLLITRRHAQGGLTGSAAMLCRYQGVIRCIGRTIPTFSVIAVT